MKLKESTLSICLTFIGCSQMRHLLRGGTQLKGVAQGYDLLILFSFAVVLFVCLYNIISKLNSVIHAKNKFNLLFITLVMLTLILPITKIDDKQESSIENRSLNIKPSLFSNNFLNYEYGRQFEAWLSDHFRGRDKFYQFFSKIDKKLSNRVENKIAFEGKYSWLFYKGDNSVKNYQNLNNFSTAQLEHIKRRLEEKRDFCESLGIKYYILIAPDKNQIYSEYYPEEYYRVGKESRGMQLYNFLKTNSTIKIVYPFKELIESKNNYEVYYRNDTHWNSVGAYYGYTALLDLIQKDFSTIKKNGINEYSITKGYFEGDLQNMLRLKERKYETLVMSRLLPNDYQLRDIKSIDGASATQGRPMIFTDSSLPYDVIVFRDSFCTAMIPYISNQFGHVEYFWTRSFENNKQYLKRKRPNIVIEECVERYAQELIM